MKLTLVNPPHSQFDVTELAPPLGLLRLAGVAQQCGCLPTIVDFNLLWHSAPHIRDQFYETATQMLLDTDADVFGFTSMAVDTHIPIELSRRIRHARPNAVIVAGGTHFSAIKHEVSLRFPWIDDVAGGEGEGFLATLLSATKSIAPIMLAPATDYAHVDVKEYFAVSGGVADVESSRGCRFKCNFCYSPGHYPQRRTLDADRLLAELSYLESRGARHVFVVDDNFLNDRQRALAVCDALREARLNLTWHCYVTVQQVDEELGRAMSDAGCVAVFTGIDAVGELSQRCYGKKTMARPGPVEVKIRTLVDQGISPTCAFLVAPPSHSCGVDAETTIQAALAARNWGATIRLNLLTYYPATRLAQQTAVRCSPDDYRLRLCLDVPDVVVNNPFALEAPALFPFHARYVPRQEWTTFSRQLHCLFTLLHARTDELTEIGRRAGSERSLLSIAAAVSAKSGDLLTLDEMARRQVEVSAFDALAA